MTLSNRLHDRHISINIHGDVKSICAPLFLTTDINYFHYGRVYPDGHSLVLITHPEFHKFFWEHEYDKIVFKNYQFEGWFINKSCSNELLHSAKHYFNVDNWLLYIKNKQTYVESFGFGTYAGNDANQLAIVIPCHRVINQNGELGGYGGGISRKQWLIQHERKHQRYDGEES